MISVKGHVALNGGQPTDFVAGPWEFSKWEQFAQRKQLTIEGSPITFSMYLAYCALNRAQWPPETGFEAWSQGITDINVEDPDEVPPTVKETSAA